MRKNALTLIDAYKIGHVWQYPEGTTNVYSNLTPRGSRVAGANGIIFFGLQYFLKEYLTDVWDETFFHRSKTRVVDEYSKMIKDCLGTEPIALDHIENLHDLGYLPLRFCAFPEGSYVPLRVPALTVENTHPEHAWLVNYIETLMSNILWKPCTSATTALHLRRIIEAAAWRTGGSKEFIPWQGHDFSFRGMSGTEDAVMSGAGHLLYFTGTDTIPAIEFLREYYHATGLIGGSVAATEHSVMCAGGKFNEIGTINRLLSLYPSGVLSVVSDTWDLWKVLTEYLPMLRSRILARNGKLVIRPDSGDPVKIICGDPEATDDRAKRGVVQLLWDTFGGTTKLTGYKTLDSHIGAIYGDSINRERMTEILERLQANGFASDNIVFGVGSFTYEYVTRDTFGFAMKATYTENKDYGTMSLYKSPVTDGGEKWSARGRLAVLLGDGDQPVLVCDATPEQEAASLLTPVWEDGEFIRRSTLAEIRALAEKSIWRNG